VIRRWAFNLTFNKKNLQQVIVQLQTEIYKEMNLFRPIRTKIQMEIEEITMEMWLSMEMHQLQAAQVSINFSQMLRETLMEMGKPK
jgi:hypothetical protein